MTNGVSDDERCLGLRTRKLATAVSWEYRRGSVSCRLTNLVSVYEHFGSRTASRNELSSWTEVPLYSLFIVRRVKRFVPYSLSLPRNLNVAQWVSFGCYKMGPLCTSYEGLTMRPDILNIAYRSLRRIYTCSLWMCIEDDSSSVNVIDESWSVYTFHWLNSFH
jgi:hypothetical protein